MSSSLLAQPCKQVIGYYPNWQWYDRNKLVNPQNIDYSKYSVINYSFFEPLAGGEISQTDVWADENLLLGQPNWSSGGYYPNTSLIDLAHNNGVKVLAAIGGWTLSQNFPIIAADSAKRDTFAQACIGLIQAYNFDGIDIDWEYPGFVSHGGTPQDKVNYTLFLQAIRSALDIYGQNNNKTLLLTTCVSASEEKMLDIEWSTVSTIVDAINVMSYDFFGTWDGTNNHNSPLNAPLQGDSTLNLSYAVEKLINHYNVNPQKINAGVAFYGRSQKTTGAPTLYGPSTGLADNVTFSTDQGTPLYYNILDKMNLFSAYWDHTAEVPYLLGNNGLNTFLSYDNEESIGLKAKYIVDNNLQGAIVWEITGDYIETSPGSGVIANTPLADTLNSVFCNYSPALEVNKLEDDSSLKVDIYPNPVTSILNIDFESQQEEVELIITNTLGQILKSKCYKNIETCRIELNLDKGLYFVKIFGSNKKERVISFVKK